MGFAEKLLYCIECKKSFIFTVEEQEYHASLGFPNEPGRCLSCRRARKVGIANKKNTDEDHNLRQTVFPVTCTQCGKATHVRFQPDKGEPVYCSNCYIRTQKGKSL
jgi:CxxC-x17-CxxC domain-containing protein